VLDHLKGQGVLKGKAQQRTDSTHVVAAIRDLNRLECVGETLRRVLDDLARVAPEWLMAQITPDWFDRYGACFEAYRLPDKKTEREALQLQIGQDGSYLLTAIYSDPAPQWLRQLPTVDVMLRIWRQQYYIEADQVQWRSDKQLPPFKLLIVSPDDIEARNRTKRETNWSGYAAHLTETCHSDEPNLITNVVTTPATTADVEVTPTVHQDLADKALLPKEHFVDTAYTSVDNLLDAGGKHNIDLVGPVAGGGSWQAKAGKGFDVSCFAVDWDNQIATCPQGKASQNWHLRQEKYGHQYFEIRFAPADCQPCPHRPDCTKSKRGVRVISLRPQVEYETLQAARLRQEADEFKTKYKKRAGIEGTISQGVRAFDLRRSRYLGLAKTHLQHLAIGAAINLTRVVTWWMAGEQTSPIYRSPFAKLAPVT
jgi:transposase